MQCNGLKYSTKGGNLVFDMEQRPCAILFLTFSNGSEKKSCRNVSHSVFGEDKQTKESQDYNKVTIRPPVLFRQKGKCRIIWYCPIAVKGEVCGNYWTVLDSSPTYSPSYWKSNSHEVTRKHDLTSKKTKTNKKTKNCKNAKTNMKKRQIYDKDRHFSTARR